MQICDHVQYARAMAHAYPYIYDVLEIIHAVYELALEAAANCGGPAQAPSGAGAGLLSAADRNA